MKKLSRQRQWQLRQQKKGLCTICGNKAVTSQHCEKHRESANARGRHRTLTKRLK